VSLRLCVLTFTGLLFLLLFAGCAKTPKHYNNKVLNRMTPVKNQGKTQLCWAYAMLAAIETEHIGRGDSVNLSPAYVEYMLSREPNALESKRAMGMTCINLIMKYGLCAHDAYREYNPDIEPPRQVFMGGAVYTPQEFARSVCAPDEYVALTSNDKEPYGKEIEIDLPDNWEHNHYLNVPMDTLLKRTVHAVRGHHGVCWESSAHAMAVVGLARDSIGHRFFIMKNSWGDRDADHGLVYLSFRRFREETLAVEMTREAWGRD
jgi:bleomycin hydrolase